MIQVDVRLFAARRAAGLLRQIVLSFAQGGFWVCDREAGTKHCARRTLERTDRDGRVSLNGPHAAPSALELSYV